MPELGTGEFPDVRLRNPIELLALLKHAELGQRKRAPLIPVFVTQFLMAWSHSIGPVYTFSLGLLVISLGAGRSRAEWLWLAGGELVVSTLWLPAALIVRHESAAWAVSTWVKFIFPYMRLVFREVYFNFHLVSNVLDWLFISWGLWLVARATRFENCNGDSIPRNCPFVVTVIVSRFYIPILLPRVMSPAAVPVLMLVAVFCLTWQIRLMTFEFVPLSLNAAPMVLDDWQGKREDHGQPWDRVAEYALKNV
ncbi:MAG: hypothetical protein ACRYG5_11670 [Janthinobacterium lividum]